MKIEKLTNTDETTSTSADDAERINDNNLNGANAISSLVKYVDEDIYVKTRKHLKYLIDIEEMI